MATKEAGKVWMTDDLNQFELIDENRKDMKDRAKKIEKSVQTVGYIPAPIIVNEKMEIIDGQARWYYCKKKGLPIAYMVIEGLNIDTCIAMNISTTNWTIRDYIRSYANRGFPSYVLIDRFIEKSPYSLNPSLWALTKNEVNNTSKKIKDGTIDVTKEDFERGTELLKFWAKFDDIETNRRPEFLEALGYCYFIKEVDNDRLDKKVHQFSREWTAVSNITDAIRALDRVYNDRLGKNAVYIETAFYDYLETISPGLGKSTRKRNMR